MNSLMLNLVKHYCSVQQCWIHDSIWLYLESNALPNIKLGSLQIQDNYLWPLNYPLRSKSSYFKVLYWIFTVLVEISIAFDAVNNLLKLGKNFVLENWLYYLFFLSYCSFQFALIFLPYLSLKDKRNYQTQTFAH